MAAHSEQVDKATLWGGNRSPFSLTYGKQMMWYFLVSDALTFGGLLTAYGFARHQAPSWPVAEQIFRAFPLLNGDYPLMYVALMTFILIVSSVTMVLAVEAGHRLDKSGVIKWLFATVIGGAIFVGSQAWEWSHFIHGSHHGAFEISDGLTGHGGEMATIQVTEADDHGAPIKYGYMSTASGVLVEGAEADALVRSKIADDEVINGANLTENEYGPVQYANYFFFITGFHGFHVFSGVIINLIVLLQVVRGAYDKRGHFEMVEKVGLYWHFVDLVWVFVFTFFYLL